MTNRRQSRWLGWLAVVVVLLPALAADLDIVSPAGDLTWLAILAGCAVLAGLGALLAYSREDVARRPLSPWLAAACACVWLACPFVLLTWPDGACGSGPLFFTSAAAMLLAILLVWPMCLFDMIVKRAWVRGLLSIGIVVGSCWMSGLLVARIAEWKDVTFRG